MHRSLSLAWMVSVCAIAACGPSATPPANEPTLSPEAPPAGGAEPESAPAAPSAGDAEPAGPSAPATGPSPEPPAGTPRLPAVTLRSFGLHVGGGANDASARQAFLQVLEQRFPEFQKCYPLVEQPGTSGTFGVDLHVPASGGAPRVEQPRTGLGGEQFRACMLRVFESVEFAPQKRPLVVSYSLRFVVE